MISRSGYALIVLLTACGRGHPPPPCRVYAAALQRCYNAAGQTCPTCTSMCTYSADTGAVMALDSALDDKRLCQAAWLDDHVEFCTDARAVVAVTTAASEACR